MTEAEWQASEGDYFQPHRMLEYLEARVTDRKLRLFSCACCRRVWVHLDESDRRVLEAAERIADGSESSTDRGLVREVEGAWHDPRNAAGRFLGALFHERRSRTPIQVQWFVSKHGRVPGSGVNLEAERDERLAQILLLRDVSGNPFRPVAFDPAWLTSTVNQLAAGIYEERAFERLPILADALQDAGCDSDDLLNHLRDQNATHVRGCWAIDLVLGRS